VDGEVDGDMRGNLSTIGLFVQAGSTGIDDRKKKQKKTWQGQGGRHLLAWVKPLIHHFISLPSSFSLYLSCFVVRRL